ncbi:MAG: hypothetical protein I3270_02090 [Candidatus Moeniiplasma glomeromycotorum]|nr:hypothetical protein [Candidatus Moeniiplasma glomeromycotorum]MCE8162488.1 hypothetical protein [Candidatus Moeniiplasma glomeromycotorum]MCE8166415.1 hypothetical protein [Candidatus Moeniiplasma glomeromycotorum]MCE8166900.1 hypothetical protein [Candidatus Moeniiplasma glomeromycotorum]
MTKELTFYITHYKENKDFILQEGSLLSLKIPQAWQKPDPDTKNPALWVCHLPNNSLGINFISLYPTELVIKKEARTYKGDLEPNGENEKERFFRCHLKLQEEKVASDDSGIWVWIFLALLVGGIIVFAMISRGKI